jgi:hypothetical protein
MNPTRGNEINIRMASPRSRNILVVIARVVYQQSRRGVKAGDEPLDYDLRAVLLIAEGHKQRPTAVIISSRTLQSMSKSGGRAGYDGAKRQKGRKARLAVDTPGCLLVLCVTAAD